ncbi:MAG: hypothetical protein AAF961_00815 [Planctomycetota bacterium]
MLPLSIGVAKVPCARGHGSKTARAPGLERNLNERDRVEKEKYPPDSTGAGSEPTAARSQRLGGPHRRRTLGLRVGLWRRRTDYAAASVPVDSSPWLAGFADLA